MWDVFWRHVGSYSQPGTEPGIPCVGRSNLVTTGRTGKSLPFSKARAKASELQLVLKLTRLSGHCTFILSLVS